MNIVNTLLYSNFVHPLLKTLDFLSVHSETLIKTSLYFIRKLKPNK